MSGYKTWLICYLKGGVGKTKSAMFIGQALAERGEEVLMADVDPGTQGLTGWVTSLVRDYPDYKRPWSVAQWARREGLLVDWIPDQARRAEASRVVLDVGAEVPDVVEIAAMLADQIILPIGTSQEEVDRLEPTWRTLAKRRQGVVPRILLTRVNPPRLGAAASLRRELVAGGYQVLNTEITLKRGTYDRFGRPIEDAGEYAELVAELVEIEEGRA